MDESSSADWQKLFQQLLAETDKDELKETADALEGALFVRSLALQSSSDGHAERKAIRDATAVLLRARVEKLGFPMDPKLLGWTGKA
jgi:hypothetical protein